MSPRRTVFEPPSPLTHEDAVAKLSSRDPEVVSRTLVAIGLFDDYEFAVAAIMPKTRSTDPVIRGAALIALAHVARVHAQVPEDVVGIVREALTDPNEYIRGQAETAAEDIEQFVPPMLRRLRE